MSIIVSLRPVLSMFPMRLLKNGSGPLNKYIKTDSLSNTSYIWYHSTSKVTCVIFYLPSSFAEHFFYLFKCTLFQIKEVLYNTTIDDTTPSISREKSSLILVNCFFFQFFIFTQPSNIVFERQGEVCLKELLSSD